jgi:plasmid stabilization system protein ParE
MKYRIELAATAKADIRGQAQWLGGEVSPAAAEKWLSGLYKAIDSLQSRPLRCPFAAENDRFPAAIRELLYGRSGRRRHKHRIIFTVRDDTVYVLYVRHTARDELDLDASGTHASPVRYRTVSVRPPAHRRVYIPNRVCRSPDHPTGGFVARTRLLVTCRVASR